MPKVSVIIPIYNNAGYLRECLDSVAAQTLADIQVICVNDGSTDGSLAIMREYEAADSRFTVIDKPNTGYGASLNVGTAAAEGEYLTVLESDDVFPEDACQAMYEFCVSQDLDFCKADASIFFGEGDGRTYEYLPASEKQVCYEAVFDAAADPGRYFARGGQPGMYRLAFLRDSGIVYHESPGATFQDTSFWAQVTFAAHRVRYLAQPCYLIRRDNPGSSEADGSKVYTINAEYDFVRQRIDEMEGIDKQKCKVACSYFRFWNYYWSIGRISPKFRREFIVRFAEEFRALDEAGELDRRYFTDDELAILHAIMGDPEAYYFESWKVPQQVDGMIARLKQLEAENAQLRAELAEVYGSKRYRLGSMAALPLEFVRRKM